MKWQSDTAPTACSVVIAIFAKVPVIIVTHIPFDNHLYLRAPMPFTVVAYPLR